MQGSALWGFGLRLQHATGLLQEPELPVLEIMIEHFAFQSGGPSWNILRQLRGRAPHVLHGLNLDIGGLDPLNLPYLEEVRRLLNFTGSTIYSDHLAFTQMDGQQTFNLLPIPLNKAHLERIADRVHRVQDILGQRLTLENIAAYHAYPDSCMPELEFLQSLAERTGCGLLLDLNNLYVNAHNFGFDPFAAIHSLEPQSVVQYHCSGHRQRGGWLHDTHDQPVLPAVWRLLSAAIDRFGPRPIILERDDDDVTLAELWQERAMGLSLQDGRECHA